MDKMEQMANGKDHSAEIHKGKQAAKHAAKHAAKYAAQQVESLTSQIETQASEMLDKAGESLQDVQTALSPAVNASIRFSKKYPIQMAFGAVAVFLVGAFLLFKREGHRKN